ncbi:hypothetical protein L202_06436 [Cryptococcus amylolentus CBS 6039]|uniref:Uncharacterized protein n=2 Tax=Cryptococcus amylolentus TaxID=104669 RepID=A0A1E3HFZ8_9TREE|nr:hypothetical protein L202_06436 [Cryptococcus amylolentus CBS 6039]ODN75244.1 hypothetical protein L202_06436 [Cryptococcus amylolentus CBS 6039]ODO03020.1 hypothetical protein I350_05864 [Cryptococcus amylolentus CBS 6273]
MSDLFEDPLKPENNHDMSLTPFHIFTLALSSLSLMLNNLPSSSPFAPLSGPCTRLTVLLVLLLLAYHALLWMIQQHEADVKRAHAKEERMQHDPSKKGEFKKKKNDWEHQYGHPSHYLTTRDGKPRLFPFPLGLAGASSALKELWWEAGNTPHVGHYNQRETPAAREQMRKEMEVKEAQRQKEAKKRLKAMEGERTKWQKRLTHLKVIMAIVCVGLVSKTLAIGCLAAWIYYVVAAQLAAMLAVKKEDEEKPAKEKQKIPTGPGMALTYLYEPDGDWVKPAGNIPTKAPTNRLMTSFESRYAM